eukprot:TRINITY_DN23873_c0_g1_i2.p1 TRINITY_DN23873_c0_g1~~TRINITY_DN23873_c0_g1_i2.p1  ORF type:complete len:327 (+),score=46.79 TRINITY_DN23873_c0_g1_i2:75-1055(+)
MNMSMALKLFVMTCAFFTQINAEDSQLRSSATVEDGKANEEEHNEQQGWYDWLTEKEATPASSPSAAELIIHEERGTELSHLGELSQDRTAVLAAKPTNKSGQTYSPSCYTFTGTSCLVSKCAPKLEAICELGKCICGSGCTGAAGKCHKEQNKLILKGFTLTNVYWPKYSMYFKRVTAFGQMSTTKSPSALNFGADRFTLYQLPGNLSGKPKFFLASDYWPDYVVTIRATTGTALSPWGTYAVKLNKQTIPWTPNRIMVTICSLKKRGYPNAIMIGSAGGTGSPIWAYIHRLSSYVYGSTMKPGSGGYWTLDPPLPEGSVPDCDH